MIKERPYPDDGRTVVMLRDGARGAQAPLTDSPAPAFEALEARMRFAARQQNSRRFEEGVNPLVAAARELFAELLQLKRDFSGEDLRVLNDRLAARMREFEEIALHTGCDGNEVMAARYALCTVLDEAVVTTPWGNESEWSSISLLSAFHGETFGGEKFFLLLERLVRNPLKHLFLLELMYLCLALGFEGKYRVLPRGTLELEALRDALYRQIRHLRGDVPQALSPHWQGATRGGARVVRVVPWWLLGVFTLGCLVALYGGFAWTLQLQREQVLSVVSSPLQDHRGVRP